ncbi:ABC transporter permease [Polymorphobacter sp.]|uniref:ABC transporter permease n=1 Tax=Polymorphobacter sp. TaxID=1909290 RepID=UPI003F714D7C
MSSLAAPASLPWLLAHELRLGLRLASGTRPWRRALALLLVLALPVGIGWIAARALATAPDTPSAAGLGLLVMAHALMLPLMASLAAVQVLRTFRDRNDLDLLLAAPVPPRRVFLAKALAVCGLVAMPFLVMLAPFVLFSIGLGHWRWGGALIVLVATATVATSLGFLLVAVLTASVGARRARTIVHLGSAALGASLFIASQAGGLSSSMAGSRAGLVARLAANVPPPPLDVAARAMVGDPGALLALVALAIAALLLAAGPGAARLARRNEETAPLRSACRGHFPASPLSALLTKELRLLWRDPETLAQVLLRFVYLVPLLLLALRDGTPADVAAGQILAGGVALATMAGSSLAWIIVCSEEAPELVEAAPLPGWQRAGAKLALACGLPLLALAPLMVWLIILSPPAAAALLPLALLGAASMALIQGWHGPRLPRAAFRKRPRAMLLMGFVEIAVAAGWAFTATLVHRQHPLAWLPMLFVALVVLVAWAGRPGVFRAPRRSSAAPQAILPVPLRQSS